MSDDSSKSFAIESVGEKCTSFDPDSGQKLSRGIAGSEKLLGSDPFICVLY